MNITIFEYKPAVLKQGISYF